MNHAKQMSQKNWEIVGSRASRIEAFRRILAFHLFHDRYDPWSCGILGVFRPSGKVAAPEEAFLTWRRFPMCSCHVWGEKPRAWELEALRCLESAWHFPLLTG